MTLILQDFSTSNLDCDNNLKNCKRIAESLYHLPNPTWIIQPDTFGNETDKSYYRKNAKSLQGFAWGLILWQNKANLQIFKKWIEGILIIRKYPLMIDITSRFYKSNTIRFLI